MTIKHRLLLSNILLVVLPVAAFFIIEILLGYIFFVVLGQSVNDSNIGDFTTVRLILFALAIIIINSLLVTLLSRTIIRPLNKLRAAAKEIGQGNLDIPVEITGKDELSDLAREFDDMRLKLKQAKELNDAHAEEKQTMIAGISHDLKTPVTSIRGYVDGLIDGVAETPEKRERYLKTIAGKTRELDRLIDELSLFSSLNIDASTLARETIDLDQLLSHIADEAKFELEDPNIELAYTHTTVDRIFIKADRMKLSRVFMNILNNSVKYKDKKNHSIQIELSSSDGYAAVKVKDNGRGIGNGSLTKIFQPFYREESSRNKDTGGSGLGLSIVENIIKEHKGYIDIESEQGEWTLVTVKLPLSEEVENEQGINHRR